MKRLVAFVSVVVLVAVGMVVVDVPSSQAQVVDSAVIVEIANADFGGAYLTGSADRNGLAFLGSETGPSSQWRITPAGDEFVHIMNVGDGSYLHLKRDGTVNTTPIVRGIERRYDWVIERSDDVVRIAPRNGTRFLDADDDGAIVDVNNNRTIDHGMAWTLNVLENPPPVAVDDAGYQITADKVLSVAAAESVTAFGTKGSALGEFDGEFSIALLGDNRIAIADTYNHRVQICDDNGTNCTSFGRRGSGNNGFRFASGVVVLNDGRIAISDWGNDRIKLCQVAASTTCTLVGGSGRAPGQLRRPYGLAITRDDRLVVADARNHRIQVCDLEFLNCAVFGSSGRAPGKFNLPIGVAVTNDDRIVVADWINHRVQVCEMDGSDCGVFGGRGSSLGQFNRPTNVALMGDGRVVVTEQDNSRVQVCEFEPWSCVLLGERGSAVGEFRSPFGAAIADDGRIFVADTFNHRVQIFAPGGVLVNDSDFFADPLTVVAFDSTSANGAAVTVNTDGSFTYDPTAGVAFATLGKGETLTDTFTYTISDGIETATATAAVTVVGTAD